MDKIYLIGQIWPPQETYKQTFEKFATWEFKLKELGYQVVNPMKLFSEHTQQNSARKERTKGLLECNSIMLLDCWNIAEWPKREFEIAMWLKYNIYAQRDYDHLINLAETLKAATPESSH